MSGYLRLERGSQALRRPVLFRYALLPELRASGLLAALAAEVTVRAIRAEQRDT